MRTADTTTNENSWRNSDCQFSSVDCPNSTQKTDRRATCPCAACWLTNEDHSASPWAAQLMRNRTANVRLRPKLRQTRRTPERRRSWTMLRTSMPNRSADVPTRTSDVVHSASSSISVICRRLDPGAAAGRTRDDHRSPSCAAVSAQHRYHEEDRRSGDDDPDPSAASFAPSVADRSMPTRGGVASHTRPGRSVIPCERSPYAERTRARLAVRAGPSRYDRVSGGPGDQFAQDLDLRRAASADGGEVLVPGLVLPAEPGVVIAGQDGSAPRGLTDASGGAHAWTLPRGPGPAPHESELIALETDCHRAHPPSLAQAGPLGALYPPGN